MTKLNNIINIQTEGLEPELEKVLWEIIKRTQTEATEGGKMQKRKRPCIIQIKRETHKILKIMSAEQNKPMGEIVEDLIRQAHQKP